MTNANSVVAASALLLCVTVAATATTYTVSTQSDFDSAGMRTYVAGDSLLLQRGAKFLGKLAVSGGGSVAQPVVVGATGSGDRPWVEGNGLTGYQGVVELQNTANIILTDLQVTNVFGTKTRSYGIFVYANSGQEYEHIVVRNCLVHRITSDDSNTNAESGDKYLGGMMVAASNGSRMNDVLIENNTLDTAGRHGIATVSSTNYDLNDTTGLLTNLVIRGNHVSYCSGDGIFMGGAYQGLVEHNVVHHAGYGGNGTPTTVSASIWGGWKNIDCVFQFNEAYDHFYSWDAAGFDIDGYSKHTVFQYNYSHDNAGGAFLAYAPLQDCVIRYNLSVNEIPFGHGNSWGNGITYYNNTSYIGHVLSSGSGGVVDSIKPPSVYNSIFVAGRYAIAIESTCVVHTNNCSVTANPTAPQEQGAVHGDPQFVNPCGAVSPVGFDSLSGFCLMATSPCRAAGVLINDNGGRDFLGVSVGAGAPDIGAFAYTGSSSIAPTREYRHPQMSTGIGSCYLLNGTRLPSPPYAHDGDRVLHGGTATNAVVVPEASGRERIAIKE